MQKRVLVDARLPWGSGIGRYVRNIVPSVAERSPTMSFTLLVSATDAAQAATIANAHPNVSVRPTGIRPFSLSEQAVLPAMARDYDLSWFTNYYVPLRWQGRFIATVHDLIHLDPSFPASRAKRFAAARTFAKVRRDAAHVIFVSRFSARLFAATLGGPRAATVIHHGIDHAGMVPAADKPRERTALVVAAAKAHKNLTMLLDAWQQARLDGWRLDIVTPGDDLRSSIDLTARPELLASVNILSGVSEAALSELYASAGFALVPSRYEGFGLPLLEAMRAGTPVVSSTADALVEIAAGALLPFVGADDRDGWVQAIRALASECGPSSEGQAQLSDHNRRIAERFTWERAAVRTAEIIAASLRAP